MIEYDITWLNGASSWLAGKISELGVELYMPLNNKLCIYKPMDKVPDGTTGIIDLPLPTVLQYILDHGLSIEGYKIDGFSANLSLAAAPFGENLSDYMPKGVKVYKMQIITEVPDNVAESIRITIGTYTAEETRTLSALSNDTAAWQAYKDKASARRNARLAEIANSSG